MDISIFLAQVYGLYMLIVGAALLLRPQLIRTMLQKFSSDRDSVVMTGFMLLIVGVPLILIHNIWDGTWHVVITIFVWITFVKGVVRVFMPDLVLAWSDRFSGNIGGVKLALWLMILFSLYLLYVGFGMVV